MKSRFDVLFEAVIDTLIISIFGMYLVLFEMVRNNNSYLIIGFVGLMGFTNVFLFSYLMRKYLYLKDNWDFFKAMLVGLFPFVWVTYLILKFVI